MRAIVEDLTTPVPIASLLPEIYQRHDEMLVLLAEALDEVIAPAWMSIDCFDAYLDADLAPRDFLEMLAGWVGLGLDSNWSEEQTRRLVGKAVELYRWRGTRRGLHELVLAFTGAEPVIEDSGGLLWSDTPGTEAPGSPEPAVRVLVELPADVPADLARLTRLIAANLPAHVAVTVEIRRAGWGDGAPVGDAPVEPQADDVAIGESVEDVVELEVDAQHPPEPDQADDQPDHAGDDPPEQTQTEEGDGE